ncbi:MAG: MFS transporter [Candidatus Sungbacteria bacterium]|nr:MFS transporter [Candidatus Sungbacteria bacterium]
MPLQFPKINQVILIIVLADFVLVSAFSFLTPIYSLFITKEITNGTVAVVGFALTIYWTVKSILQLFVARYIDRNHGEYDDFYSMIIGGFISSMVVILYYFASHIWHIYLLQLLLGVGDAFLVPPFYAIFTRHIDKGREGFEWSLYSSFSIGAGAAFGGAVGGLLATVIGFRAVFPLVGILAFVATLMLVFLRPYILPKVPQNPARMFIQKK